MIVSSITGGCNLVGVNTTCLKLEFKCRIESNFKSFISPLREGLTRKKREAFKKKNAYFMTSGKKVGGPQTKTKFQKKNEIWTNSYIIGGR